MPSNSRCCINGRLADMSRFRTESRVSPEHHAHCILVGGNIGNNLRLHVSYVVKVVGKQTSHF